MISRIGVARVYREPAIRSWLAERGGRGLPEIAAGLLITCLCALLIVVSVPANATRSSIASFSEIARNSQLFHPALPALILLPASPFAIFAWGSVAALWLVYLWLLWHRRATPVCLPIVAIAAVTFGVLALAIPPLFSTDIFSYAMFGRLAAVYGANPYLTTPARTAAADPLMPLVVWRNIPSPYAPLWTLLSMAVSLGRDTLPVVLVLRFKLLALAATWLDGWLIHRLVRRIAPERAAWAYLAFSWNPLVLISGPITGHNDAMILAFVLIGASLVQARPVFGSMWLLASALIKYSTVPLLGAAVVRLLRRGPRGVRSRHTAHIVASGLLLILLVFLPFWHGPSTLASTLDEPGRGLNNPVLQSTEWLIAHLTLDEVRIASATASVALAALLFGTWQLFQWQHEGIETGTWTVETELASWSKTSTAFLVVWPRIHSWYWLLPIGLALASGPRYRRLAITVLLTSLVAYGALAG